MQGPCETREKREGLCLEERGKAGETDSDKLP